MEWNPGWLFKGPSRDHLAARAGYMFDLILLNVPVFDYAIPAPLPSLWKRAVKTVAADGAANQLFKHITTGRSEAEKYASLDVIIGDLDSLDKKARTYFETRSTKVIQDHDQYSTDFGKAINYLRDTSEPRDIVAMGGLGGRVDQGLAQLHHLYYFQQGPTYGAKNLYLVSEQNITFLLKSGTHRIRVRGYQYEDCEVFAKYVGILPIREPSVITTKGLEWDVTDWETEMGGMVSTSNHVLPETEVVEVSTTKDVLFTIALDIDQLTGTGPDTAPASKPTR